jgi:rSAM/selenodomain-associated transferase 2
MPPFITIVTPVLRDSEAVKTLLPQVPAIPDVEMILVDGGADDELEQLVQTRSDTRLCRTIPGRGHQMNTGALSAAGEWLFFLHADSRLPAGWLDAFRALQADVVGGWFRFALDNGAWQARMIERLVTWRVRYLALPYGDQGLFVRRRIFESMGGFRELPLFEDVDFVRRLIRSGRVVQLPLALQTSSRRWTRDGWLRRSIRNVVLVSLYFAGVSPAWLADRYESGRRA